MKYSMHTKPMYSTILKSTNSGRSRLLTEEIIRDEFNFTQHKHGVYSYENGKVLFTYIREIGGIGSLFTGHSFPYGGKIYDWYYPKTVGDFLDIKQTYEQWCEEHL